MDPSTARHSIAAVPRLKLAFWAAALGVGAYLGSWMAYSLTLTSTFALLGTFFVGAVIVAILFVLAVVAVAVGLQPDKRGRPAARAVVASGLLLVVGVGIGWVMTPVLGLGYHPSPLLEADGTMTLSLEGLDGYTSLGDGLAHCRSELDSEAVTGVDANVVGRIETGTVAASVRVTALDSPDGRP
jgi:hypothetical protein